MTTAIYRRSKDMSTEDLNQSTQNLDRRRNRVSWQSGRIMHTPPPSTPPTSSKTSQHSASAALERAFASEEEQPNLFPPHFYREPTRSRSRSKQPSLNSESSVDSSTSEDSVSSSPAASGRMAGSRYSSSPVEAMREFSGLTDRDRSYSPMAAGFARLRDKGASPVATSPSQHRGRPSSSRGSVELQAKRMFDGPA